MLGNIQLSLMNLEARIKKTALEMLSDRRVDTRKHVYLPDGIDLGGVKNWCITVARKGIIVLVFDSETKFTTRLHTAIMQYIETAADYPIVQIVVILNNPPTKNSAVMKAARLHNSDESKDTIQFEFFARKLMTFNITRHKIVPRHYILRDSETKRKLESMKLLSIFDSDPIATYYGAKVGDIFVVLRNNNNHGAFESYRRVVASH